MASEPEHSQLTHVDARGEARMVDVSGKDVTLRSAEAAARISMRPETLALISQDQVKKGDVLNVARIAGIMAAKQTDRIIPLCHGLPLTAVEIEFELEPSESAVAITARVRTEARTGVEMEALVAVMTAALTIYDMCKAVDRGMVVENVRVRQKSGGRSGEFHSA